jgi:uncharacterized protein (DUF433 family)
MRRSEPVVHSHPEILSGAPVFVGTRVPVRTMLDYLEGGDTLDEFLDDFPGVSREQAVQFLEKAAELAVDPSEAKGAIRPPSAPPSAGRGARGGPGGSTPGAPP